MSDTKTIRYDVDQGIGVITIDNPPVNALGAGTREQIMEALSAGQADPLVLAFVLIGAGANFIAGSDMRRFGDVRPVSTRVSAAALESSTKPVVAAIDGAALGGGLEHAMACHYRIAMPSARLGLPEVSLGLVPGGGGTQRLPRLIGAAAALDMIVSSRQVSAAEAQRLGLIDRVVDAADLRTAAIEHARDVAALPVPRTRDRALDGPEVLAAALRDARDRAGKRGRHLIAPRVAIECVEAAMHMTFDEGILHEQRAFERLESSDQAKALRYAFFAEREAAKIPGVPAAYKPPAIESAAVIGAGTMGGGIAICFADIGVPVKILDATPEGLERGIHRIRDTYAARARRGSLPAAEIERRMALIQPVDGYDAIGDCDVAIEAVFERIDLKREVFSRLDAVMKPGALLLTNSSAIDIDVMADSTRRPGDVAGAHFFAPANVMKLLEVVRGNQSSIESVVRASRLARRLGKVSVVAGSCDGFAANRSRAPLVTEAMLMLEEGVLPEQVDRVMVEFGYPMGPFAVSDLSGLDVSYDTRKRRAAANPDFRKLHVPDRMVEMGRKGQKNGAGWYRYEPGERTPRPDDAVREIIASVAAELGTPHRAFDDEEILRRLLFASVNEACRIVEEGKAYRASDIDVMWINGFGFPRHRGGLMYWADTIGAAEILRQVNAWHGAYGRRWTPAPLLSRVADAGGSLRDAVAPSIGETR